MDTREKNIDPAQVPHVKSKQKTKEQKKQEESKKQEEEEDKTEELRKWKEWCERGRQGRGSFLL